MQLLPLCGNKCINAQPALATRMSERDARLARLVARRHRIASIRALRALGFTRSAVSRRVAEGRLTRLHDGVYLVGPPPPSERGKWLAAVIALGTGAVLSHRSQAKLLGLLQTCPSSVDVTIEGRGRRPRRGITVHTTRAFHPDDLTAIDGIPGTSVERTLLDLADVVTPRQLQRAYEQAEKLRFSTSRSSRPSSSAAMVATA